MKKFLLGATILGACVLLSSAADADVTLVKNGVARVAIHASPEVMGEDIKIDTSTPFVQQETETQRRRLRDSIRDLAQTLQKMTGAQVGVLQRSPLASDKLTPIYIGQYAVQKFGAMKTTTPFKQGYRIVVSKDGVGLMGDSDEATSYAIYTLLDELGCRWFLPGEIGEVVPRRSTLRLHERDVSDAPDTYYRGVWYADEAFKRRNRLGGFWVQAGHALEYYITKEQREAHPEWRAIVGGKPHVYRLKWSNPAVSDAIADAIIARLDQQYAPSVSLSPEDGMEFDETDDTKLDAGDFDASMNQVSITDRYVNLCNRIAERVTKKYPDVQFGFLAYASYTRPPVREKLHPNLIPQIAPIAYCRAHAITDTAICPSRQQIRPIIEGWGKAAPGRVSYYNYMFHLAEVTVPYPMMHQMSEELPILYKNGIAFWQPETMPNFESVLPGMWLTLRMSWDNSLQSQAVLDEFFEEFYGAASPSMRRYWQIFDDAWKNDSEHAGCGWGYLHRFTPQVMQAARLALDEALATAKTPMECRRIEIQDDSLRQFERFMQMRRELTEGRLVNLDLQSAEWLGTQIGLGNEYLANYAFSKVAWTPKTIGGGYFAAFYEMTYLEAARISKEYSIVGTPLREWKYQVAQKQEGEAQGWHKSEYSDAAWKTTDVGVETWYSLGLADYYGPVWYRQTVQLPKIPAGKKVFLWISATDGNAKVFVNGQHVPYVNAKGDIKDEAAGYAEPFSFDITATAKSDSPNQITIVGTRTFLNELGTGGLMGPVYLYREK